MHHTDRKKWDICSILMSINACLIPFCVPERFEFFARSSAIQLLLWLFRAQEPIGSSDLLWSRVVRRPSVVRPSVRRPLNYLHFQLLHQNRLMDFDETWYGWSTQGPLQVLLFFGQIRRGADPGRGKNRSRGSPSSRNFFFSLEGYSNKPNA